MLGRQVSETPELCAEESYHEIPLEEFTGSRAKFRAWFWHLTAVSERRCCCFVFSLLKSQLSEISECCGATFAHRLKTGMSQVNGGVLGDNAVASEFRQTTKVRRFLKEGLK